MRGNSHVRCEAGEKTEIISKSYLLLSKRANETGSIFEPDIRTLRADYERLWSFAREVMKKLAKL